MSKRYPKAKWVLPQIIDPPDRLCFKVPVPKEKYHIAAFRGALFALTSAIYWQDDLPHTAKEVALVWREIWENIIEGCDCPAPAAPGGADIGEQMIRQNPENSCQLQTSIDGIAWCTFADFSSCVGANLQNSFQPGPQEQPPPGGCSEFDVTVNANNVYLLPVSCGGGDVVTITKLTGGWLGGIADIWRCPTSQEYAFGSCFGSSAATSGTDLCPALPHMRLIANDGTNCYDAASGSFTIDSGVIDGTQLTFQANDSDLTDNAGSASFHVKICKNSTPIAFYYSLFTNVWAVSPSIATIRNIPIANPGTYHVVSDVPDDPSHSDNLTAWVYMSFYSSIDGTGNGLNPSNVHYKLTAISVSGATLSGGPYDWHEDMDCSGAGTHVTGQSSLPSLPIKLVDFQIRSHTQFIVDFTVEPCS